MSQTYCEFLNLCLAAELINHLNHSQKRNVFFRIASIIIFCSRKRFCLLNIRKSTSLYRFSFLANVRGWYDGPFPENASDQPRIFLDFMKNINCRQLSYRLFFLLMCSCEFTLHYCLKGNEIQNNLYKVAIFYLCLGSV